MSKIRSWTDDELKKAVTESLSYRKVIDKLNLIPAGGNYDQVKRRIRELKLDTSHFTGRRWNAGLRYGLSKTTPVSELLFKGSSTQSYKLKNKLFSAGIKYPKCEKCGWAEQSADGRIPVELDHINGDKTDNRLFNLQILCPNCHSLQPTHRGKNKGFTKRG